MVVTCTVSPLIIGADAVRCARPSEHPPGAAGPIAKLRRPRCDEFQPGSTTGIGKSVDVKLVTIFTGKRQQDGELFTAGLVLSGLIVVGVFTATLTSVYVGEESQQMRRAQDRLHETLKKLTKNLPEKEEPLG